jgi:hypothetical protein
MNFQRLKSFAWELARHPLQEICYVIATTLAATAVAITGHT